MSNDVPWFALDPDVEPAHTMRIPEGGRIGVAAPLFGEAAQVGRYAPDEVPAQRVDGGGPFTVAAQVGRYAPDEMPAQRIGTMVGEPVEAGRSKASEGVPLGDTIPAMPVEAGRSKTPGSLITEGIPRKATETGRRAGTANGTEAVANSQSGRAGTGFVVNPDQYKAAVSPVLRASEQIASLASSMASYLPSMESQKPWGDDESGKQFAEGEDGYLGYSQDTLKTLQSLAKEVKDIADGLKSMAENYEAAEEGATSSFVGTGGGDAPLPAPPGTAPTVPSHVRPMMTPGVTRPNGRH